MVIFLSENVKPWELPIVLTGKDPKIRAYFWEALKEQFSSILPFDREP